MYLLLKFYSLIIILRISLFMSIFLGRCSVSWVVSMIVAIVGVTMCFTGVFVCHLVIVKNGSSSSNQPRIALQVKYIVFRKFFT